MDYKKKSFTFFVFSCLIISIFTVLILSEKVSAQPSNCFRPSPFPKAINQSGTICPGIYRFGITVADNIRIDCNNSATFLGNSWNGTNGLTISGKRNIEVVGCTFERFRENGIFIGNDSKPTYNITLGSVNIVKNRGNGIFVGHNVIDFYLITSRVSENRLEGVKFKSNYIGLFNNPSAKLFPSGIYLLQNSITENKQNGIYFDAYDYLALVNNFNIVSLFHNGSIAILGNNISNNNLNGIKSEGLSAVYSSHIMGNILSYNGLGSNSSGILILANRSKDILNYPNNYSFKDHGLNGFRYIHSNDLQRNSLDGISLYVAKESPYTPKPFNWSIKIEGIHYNYIRDNVRNGISFLAENTTNNITIHIKEISQNDISKNYQGGAYFKGLNKDYGDSFRADFLCNDILLNGNGNNNGVEVVNFSRAVGYFGDHNIVENNSVGLIIQKGKVAGEFLIGWNNFGFNNQGLMLFGNSTSLGLNRVRFNDFDRNTLQAYDLVSSEFTHSWWSDYSPGCLDSQPDGWCDIPRPVPVANQDIEPRAGNIKYGWKNRGYFAKAIRGVSPKSLCSMPEIPPIPGLPGSSGGKEPGGTTEGETEGGNSGGSDGSTGEPPKLP